MTSTRDKLVRMVNQIATEFDYQQGANAAAATWDHLWHFWDPAMRAQIITHLDQGGEGLGDTARQAVAMLRTGAEAPSQTGATDFTSKTASDAG
jgi:formate dehydrogenase subunit delta